MKISLLTKPFSPIARCGKEAERRFNYYKYLLCGNHYKVWTCTNTVGGHQDVVSSFIEGAVCFPDVEIMVNPLRRNAEGSILYVSAGWRTLRDAIAMKQKGLAQTLIAGPIISDRPCDYDFIIANPAIDIYIVASQWYKDFFQHELKGTGRSMNIDVWAAGVNDDLWSPKRVLPSDEFKNALVYGKQEGIAMLPEVTSTLKGLSKNVKQLRCKSHTPAEYKDALEWADFVVFCGETETQGLAFSQAWSMNRQTLIYKNAPKVLKTELDLYGGHDPHYSIAAPYLTPATGALWANYNTLTELVINLQQKSPRSWILDNQTNKIAFSKFLDMVSKL